MPELPEVETVARTLAPHVVNKKITAVEVLNPKTWQGEISPQDFLRMGTARINKTGRKGKLLLLYLSYAIEDGDNEQSKHDLPFALAFHLKMTGRVFPYPKNTEPTKHTRVFFELDDGNRIFFEDVRKFGYIRVLTKANIQTWDFWKNLAKDPFEMSTEEFIQTFKNKKTPIKSLLLNQKHIAGIGNIYADEALFLAKIHPQTLASSLDIHALGLLFEKIIAVLEESIRFCGSSIKDYRTANGDVGSFQNKFYAYGRDGQACRLCQTSMEKISVGGRGTVFCPSCQK